MSEPGGNDSSPPPQPKEAQVDPDAEKLKSMNASAQKSASATDNGAVPCDTKKSWFAFRVIDHKDSTVIEGLTLKLKLPSLGDIDRVTAKANDPIKVEALTPGGTGELAQIDAGTDAVWEAVGDIA